MTYNKNKHRSEEFEILWILRYKINDEAKLEVPKVNVLQNPFYQEIKVHPILAGIIQGTQN
jgi:hypothetical protein